jgi:NADH-quinone oxidoreductase subunit E
LWRAQEQEGWLSRPAIEYVAEMLGMAYIRALEVATFYFMFQLQPTGSVAHVQVCGTTSCMICGAEDLIAVCREKIGPAHSLSDDGTLSWEEVECLGACANAPMAQIGKDYYEDLTAERFGEILDELSQGKVPTPGPQNGRFAAEPIGGITSLTDGDKANEHNASVALALGIGDTVKRIDGTEVPLRTPWRDAAQADPNVSAAARDDLMPPEGPDGTQGGRVDGDDAAERDRGASSERHAEVEGEAPEAEAKGHPEDTGKPAGRKPELHTEAPADGGDDLKRINGVGPKLEELLHSLGVWHFSQIAKWDEDELDWIDDNLGSFKGRARRDEWIAQAKELSAED